MDTLGQMDQALQDDFSVNDNSTLYTPALRKRALGRAYRKIGGLFRWPETEDAKKTSTEANIEYYDYPDNWRPNSIWKLKVDGVDYGDPLAFRDYQFEQENDNPSQLERMWANQWRRYFIDPIPTTNGDNNIEVWGQKVVDDFVNDSSVTIFSYSMPEVNEAIVLEAGKILKSKGEEVQVGDMLSLEAKQIAAVAFGKIKQELAKYERTTPMFEVPDLFGRGRQRTRTGRFD